MTMIKIVNLNKKINNLLKFNIDKFLETRNSLSLRNTTTKNKNSTSTNYTKSNNENKNSKNEEKFPAVVDKAPYIPVDCSQTLILKAKRLANDNNYAVKKEAFFTMNPIRINVFDQMNAASLLKSIRMPGLDWDLNILSGSLNCLFFHDEVKRHHNVSMCIDDKNTTNQIKEAYNFFRKCENTNKKLRSKIDDLEILVNTLSNPKQEEYKIPDFKRQLAEKLTEEGVIILIYMFIFNFSFLWQNLDQKMLNLIVKKMPEK